MTTTTTSDQAALPDIRRPGQLPGVLFRSIQLGLLVCAVKSFQLESKALVSILELTLGGYVLQAFLPQRWRLPLFAGLSMAGIALVLGLESAAWVLGVGTALLALCHLPIPFWSRVLAVALAGGSLAALRGGWIPNSLPSRSWPVLGSLFMFRLLVYLYDLRHEKKKEPFRLSGALSYFFLLPNVCFPLFPVVDYKTFRATDHRGKTAAIHQQGLDWILRGVLHLLLYRVVYYHVTIGIGDVHSLGTLARFLLGNLFLYLRISGQFHLIVGVLKLFGFNLPETNHLYFLASSFNDYWRRINIYWKDFMMKLFYYPAFFQLRRWGTTPALVLATGMVFLLSWMLHSYQWFWILGDFPIRAQDGLFWGIVGVLVLANTLYEDRFGRRRSLKTRQWTPGQIFIHVLKVASVFTSIAMLWSLWTAESLREWTSMWRDAATDLRLGPVELLLVLFPVLLGLAAVVGQGALPGLVGRARAITPRRDLLTPVLTLLVVLAGAPHLYERTFPRASELMADLKVQRLNDVDQERLEGGYYQQLLTVNRFDSALLDAVVVQPVARPAIEEKDLFSWRDDFLRLELTPNREGVYLGQPFSSNRWGMRDRDYSLGKPPNTLRIAFLGSSHVMGHGVADEDVFEALLEDRLNRESMAVGGPGWQILNFAVVDHAAVEQLIVFKERGLPFQPDAVFYFGHTRELTWTTNQLWQNWTAGREIPFSPLRTMIEAAVDTQQPPAVQREQIYGTSGEALTWIYGEIVRLCREIEATPVYIFLPRLDEGGKDRLRPYFLQIAEEAGFYVVSIADLYSKRDRDALRISPTDNHPNSEGHRLIADRLYQEIQLHARDMGLTDGPTPEEDRL